MTDLGNTLPVSQEATVVEPMAAMVGLPAEVVSTTLAGAENILRTPTYGNSYFISLPPYSMVTEAEFSSRAGGSPAEFFPKQAVLDRFSRRGLFPAGDIIWAPDETSMGAALERRHAYETAKAELSETHQLHAGGLVLANPFGGIDVSTPEDSAKHLILRTIIAGDAKLGDIESLVKAGLLHPLLAEVVGADMALLMNEIGEIVKVLGMIPESARAATAPGLLASVDERAQAFIEAHYDEIMATAFVASNPELIRRISGLDDELTRRTKNGLGSVISGLERTKLIIPQTGLLNP